MPATDSFPDPNAVLRRRPNHRQAKAIVFPVTLRSKFLLSLALISALLTWATLMLVRHRIEIHVRQEIVGALRNSVTTFSTLQAQRETTLEAKLCSRQICAGRFSPLANCRAIASLNSLV